MCVAHRYVVAQLCSLGMHVCGVVWCGMHLCGVVWCGMLSLVYACTYVDVSSVVSMLRTCCAAGMLSLTLHRPTLSDSLSEAL